MTQVGEGREATAEDAGPVMTVGAPSAGEILAERYQLEEHVNNDSAGRQVWRGVDVILRRPVAVVLRYPGGDSATEMLQAAVAASRVIHPNLAGVYDAIDEDTRAYVVREWVDGESLREVVAEAGPLDPARATSIAHAVTDALVAVHNTGMVHGNVHPGTTMIADDGRVVLADARADSADTTEGDVRAIGGILYFALTGHWPHVESGPSNLPDAVRDGSGTIAAPRQARAGIPAYLDDLTMDLLDKRIAAPDSDVLAAELARLDADEDYLDDSGPLRFASGDPSDAPRATRKIVIGVAALLLIAAIGLVFGINAIASTTRQNETAQAGTGSGPGGRSGAPPNGSGQSGTPQKIALTAEQVRIVDPPGGSRNDTGKAAFTVDNNRGTGWETQGFNGPNFGGLKSGMGVLINLGTPRSLSEVRLETNAPGAVVSLKTGAGDPGDTTPGDKQIVDTYQVVGENKGRRMDGTREVFGGFNPAQKHQYLLVWVSELPKGGDDGRYRLTVSEIEVYGS